MKKLISDDLKNMVQKEISKVARFKKILSDEEITERMKTVEEFYSNPINKDQVYFDGTRHWIFIQSPEPEEDYETGKPKNRPEGKESKFEPYDILYNWRVTFPLGSIQLSFVTKQQIKEIGWGNFRVLTGKLRTQYRIGSSNDYFDSLADVAKALNLSSVKDLDDTQYYPLYSFNIWQVITV